MDLFDINGKKIRRIIDIEMLHGEHEIDIDVGGLSSGLYFVLLQSGERYATTKLLIAH